MKILSENLFNWVESVILIIKLKQAFSVCINVFGYTVCVYICMRKSIKKIKCYGFKRLEMMEVCDVNLTSHSPLLYFIAGKFVSCTINCWDRNCCTWHFYLFWFLKVGIHKFLSFAIFPSLIKLSYTLIYTFYNIFIGFLRHAAHDHMEKTERCTVWDLGHLLAIMEHSI